MTELRPLLSGCMALTVLAGFLEPATLGAQATERDSAAEFLISAGDHPQEWRTHGGTYDEQRHSTLSQINESTVSSLGLAWTFDTGTTRGLEATPLVVDGVLYATLTWSRVVALDARTGQRKWSWDPEIDRAYGRRACCEWQSKIPNN